MALQEVMVNISKQTFKHNTPETMIVHYSVVYAPIPSAIAKFFSLSPKDVLGKNSVTFWDYDDNVKEFRCLFEVLFRYAGSATHFYTEFHQTDGALHF